MVLKNNYIIYKMNFNDQHFNDRTEYWGLRDKYDQSSGLVQVNPKDTQFNVLENTIVIDSRDCIGKRSLKDARSYFIARGGKGPSQGTIVNVASGINMVVTFDTVANFNEGDMITISGVMGTTEANGNRRVSNINTTFNTAQISAGSSSVYTGGGVWYRNADHGYPELTENDSTINGNTIIVNLNKELKFLRTMTLYHIVLPRDIIPLSVYLADFISTSTDENNKVYATYTTTDYTTFIPQERSYMEERMLGFYSTPLDLWRSYTFGTFSMQDQYTPMPLEYWNPPVGDWPLQPLPYPYQTVPTYRSNTFSISIPEEKTGNFYIILSGYGVYDLVDWTIPYSGLVTIETARLQTDVLRKLLLFILCSKQSLNNVDYIDLILNCHTVSENLDINSAYGFGDFQRYIPGPGVGQHYQPGTFNLGGLYTNGAPLGNNTFLRLPNVVGAVNMVTGLSDNPIPFPNFKGNVWGPYSKPGDRFQKMGLRTIIQDLYLNGDLNNLLGSSIVVPNVPAEGLIIDENFGLNFSAQIEANLQNITDSTNPNILNAMRIVPNGFGAVNVRANGNGTYYINRYANPLTWPAYGLGAGGLGPSSIGAPNSWANNSIYVGGPSFSDPIAQGIAGPNATTVTSDASSSGTTVPVHETSFFDLGPNNGAFQLNITKYISYVVNDLPDTDVIMKIEEALHTERFQSTRSFNGDAMLDCPIRLNLGSTSGTLQYVESLQSLLASATGYWEKRYFNPKASIEKLHITFWSYEGKVIPLEKMLQIRRSLDFLQNFVRVNSIFNINFNTNPFSFNFLFDPLNPQLLGRVKRYLQIILKAQTYQGTPPGLEPTLYTVPNTKPLPVKRF